MAANPNVGHFLSGFYRASAIVCDMNERQKLGSGHGVPNGRIWVRQTAYRPTCDGSKHDRLSLLDKRA